MTDAAHGDRAAPAAIPGFADAPLIGKLRQARIARGLSTAAVDSRAGWPRNTCAKLEALDHNPSLARLQAWATALVLELDVIPLEPPRIP